MFASPQILQLYTCLAWHRGRICSSVKTLDLHWEAIFPHMRTYSCTSDNHALMVPRNSGYKLTQGSYEEDSSSLFIPEGMLLLPAPREDMMAAYSREESERKLSIAKLCKNAKWGLLGMRCDSGPSQRKAEVESQR